MYGGGVVVIKAHPMNVSVVIPTFNRSALLLEAVHSVRAQTSGVDEIIIVNDGSTDDTRDALGKLSDAGDIKYFEQPNSGQAAARNRGLAEASCDFVVFLDDDDLLDPQAVAVLLAQFGSHPDAIVAVGAAVSFPAKGVAATDATGRSGQVLASLYEENWITSPGQTMVRRTALLSVGGFNSAIRGVEDWDLYIRLAEQASFSTTESVVLRYRVSAESTSKRRCMMYLNARRMLLHHRRRAVEAGLSQAWDHGMTRLKQVGARLAIDEICESFTRDFDRQAAMLLCHVTIATPSLLVRRSVWKQLFAAIRS